MITIVERSGTPNSVSLINQVKRKKIRNKIRQEVTLIGIEVIRILVMKTLSFQVLEILIQEAKTLITKPTSKNVRSKTIIYIKTTKNKEDNDNLEVERDRDNNDVIRRNVTLNRIRMRLLTCYL
jgi:hypothetical protein